MKQKKIGIFAGCFKPAHIGHFNVAEMSAKQNDETYILISSADRDGITSKHSKSLWKLYSKLLKGLHIIVTKQSPVRTAYELVEKLNQSTEARGINIYLYCDKDDMERYKRMRDYYHNLRGLYMIEAPRFCSATEVRNLLSARKIEQAIKYFPPAVNQTKLLAILQSMSDTLLRTISDQQSK